MRALTACLTVFLGLSATLTMASMVGCSDSTDAGGSGGASGATTAGAGGASAGAGGAVTAGSSGSGGEAGAADCKFETEDCTSCVSTECGTETQACLGDPACATALVALQDCACAGTETADECATDFGNDGGELAPPLAVCYTDHCVSACQ